MVGVVKIQIFLLLVPILHNSQLAPRPHHQLQKKTLIIVVAHFLFLSYSLSLQLYMLQQLGFFSCRVEKKRNNKQHRWTELDRRDRTFLSSFCVSATLARSVRTVTQIHCGIVGGFGRHLSPQACCRASQWCGAPRTATRPRSAAAAAGVWKWKHGLGNLLLLAGMAPITLFCCSSRASFAGRMPAATASIFCPFPA